MSRAFPGITRNSLAKMTASSSSEHIRECDLSLAISGGSWEEKAPALAQLAHKPHHHEAVAPVGKHWRTGNGLFRTALRIRSAEQAFRFSIRDFNAPPMCISVYCFLIRGPRVRVEQSRIRTVALVIENKDDSENQSIAKILFYHRAFGAERPELDKTIRSGYS